MSVKSFIVLFSIFVNLVISEETWYETHNQASCNSCCPSLEYLEVNDGPEEEASCSSIHVEITKKQNAQIRLAKPKFKQYRKKLLNGKRPDVEVVTFDDDYQIKYILERYGDMFQDKRPRKFPRPEVQPIKVKPTPKPEPEAQNDMGENYQAPLWPFVIKTKPKPRPTPRVGSSWTYHYSSTSSKTRPVQTVSHGSQSRIVTLQTVVGKRKRRDTNKKKIEVCPTRESWQDLNLALNTDGKLVQIVQLPDNKKQWILEEVCSKKTSPVIPNVSCETRPRVITAVVVPLSGNKGSSEIQVQEIQIHCCAAYHMGEQASEVGKTEEWQCIAAESQFVVIGSC